MTECERQIKYLDELIQQKDTEKDKIKESYRKLIAEHERVDLNCKLFDQEINDSRMEITMRDKKIQQLQRCIEELTNDIARYWL